MKILLETKRIELFCLFHLPVCVQSSLIICCDFTNSFVQLCRHSFCQWKHQTKKNSLGSCDHKNLFLFLHFFCPVLDNTEIRQIKMKSSATGIAVSNRNIRLDTNAVWTCVWALEGTADQELKEWYVLVSKDTARTCRTGERIVCITARKPAPQWDHSAGDQQWKISKLTAIKWQQGCRTSHMPFIFLLVWKENKNLFQNTRKTRSWVGTLPNIYGSWSQQGSDLKDDA